MRTNTRRMKNVAVTHEGAVVPKSNDMLALRRAVLGCLLFEDTFYENGVAIADRITQLIQRCDSRQVETKSRKELPAITRRKR